MLIGVNKNLLPLDKYTVLWADGTEFIERLALSLFSLVALIVFKWF